MNRNPIQQWFITFPQIGEVESKENFHKMLPPSSYSLTCLEEHKEGGQHLHMVIKLKKGITHSNLVKWIKAKYPDDWKRIHFEGIKNLSNSQDYCMKEDPLSLQIGDIAPRKAKYTEEKAMADIMEAMWLRANIDGERKKYLQTEENRIREEFERENKDNTWLRQNGYLPE